MCNKYIDNHPITVIVSDASNHFADSFFNNRHYKNISDDAEDKIVNTNIIL